MFDTLKLQAYTLQPNIELEVYCYQYPQQWIESFQTVNLLLGKDKRHLPFKKIKEFLYSWDPNILFVNDFTNTYRQNTWILSRKPIDESTVIAIFKMCLQITIDLIKNPYTKEAFENWINNLDEIIELKLIMKRIPLTTNEGTIHENNLAFEVLPRFIYQQLESKPLVLGDQTLSFIPTHNGMLSEPNLLCYSTKNSKYYYSIRLIANIQTTPHQCTPMIQFKFSITRWMNYKLPLYSRNESNTSVYAHLDNRLVKIEIVKKNNQLFWEPSEHEMYNAVYIGQPLPAINELVNRPNSFNNFYVSHRLEFGNIAVGAGESMHDRYILNDWITSELDELIKPFASVLKSKSVIGQNSKKRIKDNLENIEKVHEVLAKVTGQKQLFIEVLYIGEQEELINLVKQNLEMVLGVGEGEFTSEHIKISISYSRQNELLSSLDETKKEKDRHEERIQQIQQTIHKSTGLTACLVLLPFINEEGHSYYKEKEDPKKAIRAGLATTGRLSQFIDSMNPKSPEYRVKVAIHDLLRQLGYIDPFETNKFETVNYDTTISALHIVNFKRTPYGNTKRAVVYIVRKANQGPVLVECPALWNGQKYYWEASLAFQEIATVEGFKKFNPERVIGDIKNKIYELSYKKDQPHLLLLFSDGVTRKEWPFITDKNLSSINKEELYTLKSIWFEKGKENEGLTFTDENQLRLVRVRVNDEVPDYLTPKKENGEYQSKKGLFSLNEVFYSLGEKPLDAHYANTLYSNNSKLLMQNANKPLKFSNIVELYPIHLNKEDNPEEWISLTHNYRVFAHQYKGTLKAPLLLHMAKQLEEYIY
ncbi:DUF3962 domain-containing protein [Lysinibacillus sp. FSL H8-0500]|uniref:pPIWI_RE module domain-containing protein n=1 Tax=Lysinibacillus sp. FSL H8-0500 TaxID=2921393 RepID=UPI003100EC79